MFWFPLAKGDSAGSYSRALAPKLLEFSFARIIPRVAVGDRMNKLSLQGRTG